MAALLVIASMPGASTGLIERLQCSECEVHLMPVKGYHLRQVVHISIVVLRRQVIFGAVGVATAVTTNTLDLWKVVGCVPRCKVFMVVGC